VSSHAGVDCSQASAFVLCFCGLADPATGRVVSTNQKYDDATRIDLPEWCRRELGLSFMIENDARMALLGECYAGAAQGETDVVMVTLGTGIGGAVLMNGKVLRSKHILGGNLCGHIPVDFNGRRCTCGSHRLRGSRSWGLVTATCCEGLAGICQKCALTRTRRELSRAVRTCNPG